MDERSSEGMPLFVGTKTLHAAPMNKHDYCRYRGWDVPADEDPEEAGYLVEYTDGGKPNVEGHAGYVSWSPADVFERSYRPASTHVDRMKIELAELQERTDKLHAFVGMNPAFQALQVEDQRWMMAQMNAMLAYSVCVATRIERANG